MRNNGDLVVQLFFFALALTMVYCLWVAPLMGW